MNAAQKSVRLAGVLLLVAMALFPPWRLAFSSPPENVAGSAPLGYHSLWFHYEPPADETRTNLQQRIDLVRLGCQLGGVLIVTNVALMLLKTRRA